MAEECIFHRAHAKQNDAPSILLLVTGANRPSSEAPRMVDRRREYLLERAEYGLDGAPRLFQNNCFS